MIEYIVPNNIDDRILAKGADILINGGIVALPTGTSWSIVCSYKSRDGIRKLRSLSGGRDEEHFTLLCSEITQISDLCSLDTSRFRLIKRLTPGPYVFVMNTLLTTGKTLNLQRKEIGVRIPDNSVPHSLIEALGLPLYSITAKRSMIAEDGAEPESADNPEDELFDGGWELEDIKGIDLILDPGEDQERLFSTVLDLRGNEVSLLRAGAGKFSA